MHPLVTNLAGHFDPCAYKNLYNVGKPDVDKITQEVRKRMIGFLQGDQNEIYQKFQEVDKECFYNESRDFTCFLCPKEKEAGDVPRLF